LKTRTKHYSHLLRWASEKGVEVAPICGCLI
jgi:hypothetical protein